MKKKTTAQEDHDNALEFADDAVKYLELTVRSLREAIKFETAALKKVKTKEDKASLTSNLKSMKNDLDSLIKRVKG